MHGKLSSSNPFNDLFRALKFLGKKALILAGVWVAVYFFSRLFTSGPLMLIEPTIGAIVGAAAGWEMADDAVAECGFSGPTLWILLVLACWCPIWLVERVMTALMHALVGWQMTFGEWMLLTMATIFSMIAAIWRELADD
ncbi:MAG TPA: hypothetical protein VMG59_08705 [Phycisphaerae bacterium]|nr:hypothetical protein [Phycisphaerae bacterium]